MIELTVPYPPKELSPNARVHPMSRARAIQQYRTAVGWHAKTKRPSRPWLSATVYVRGFYPSRQPDRDNFMAMLKAAWDAFQDVGIVRNDRDLAHRFVSLEQDRKDPRLELTVVQGIVEGG